MIDRPPIRHLMAIVSGAVVPLAYAPFNLWWLMPIAMAVPMLLWQQDTPRQGFLHGWLFGLGMFAFGLAWIRISISIYGNIPILPALAISSSLAAFLALYTGLIGAIACSTKKIPAIQRQLLLIPSLWVIAEWLRARLLGGFGWLSPGYTQTDSPLSALLPLGGTLLVLFALAASAGLLVLASQHKQQPTYKPKNIVASLAVIWLAALCLTPLQWSKPEGKMQQVALVQGAIAQELKWEPAYLQKTKQLYQKLSAPHWSSSDLIIWPEAVIPAFRHQVKPYLKALNVRRAQASLLLGIPTYDKETEQLHNSMIVLSDQNHTTGDKEYIYHKKHLVPFGEYLPLAKLLKPIFLKLNIPYSEFSSGDSGALLPTTMGPAGIMICYEVIFAHTVLDKLPQAKVLVNVSNDAWFGDSIGPHQHLQIAQTRARETGRYLLRATNNGISAIINPQGEVISKSRQFTSEVVTGKVSAMVGKTPYIVLGDTLMLTIALLIIAGLAWRSKHQQ